LLILCIPILLNTQYILELWLKLVPEHTVFFVQLTLIFALCESISGPLVTAMLATGDIKKYQIIVGGLQMLNLPVSYLFLRLGAIPESVTLVSIIISQLCLFARLLLLRNMIGLKIMYYMKYVYFNVITVSLLSLVLPFFLVRSVSLSLSSFIIVSLLSVLNTIIVELFVGCSKEERQRVYSLLYRFIKHNFISNNGIN